MYFVTQLELLNSFFISIANSKSGHFPNQLPGAYLTGLDQCPGRDFLHQLHINPVRSDGPLARLRLEVQHGAHLLVEDIAGVGFDRQQAGFANPGFTRLGNSKIMSTYH
jgi:hypothetical protein